MNLGISKFAPINAQYGAESDYSLRPRPLYHTLTSKMLPARNWLLLSIVYLVCALTVAARLNCQDLDIIGAPVLG